MPSRSDDSHSIFRPSFQSKAPEADPVGVHLQSGDSVGDFELVKLIGHGGMGSVWAAYEKSLDRAVALKVIRPDRVDSKAVEMFHREARAGGRLSHPGLVSVYSSGEGGGVHHIALEMVGDGHNLAHVLKTLREQESVPDGYYGEVAEFVLAVAEAMESAHQADVIHRDLKPQNILIDAEGEPRITDFGLARIVGERSLSGREVVGTYFYMSPEQAMAKSVGIDLRTDIFSLGVVMYELLTLKRPFDGDTEQQIQKQIIWEDPFAPRAVRSRVPADLSVICMKCLEKRAEHRFASMAELVADLRRHLIHEPIRANSIHADAPSRAVGPRQRPRCPADCTVGAGTRAGGETAAAKS
jgi:serine/threonine protein kinase